MTDKAKQGMKLFEKDYMEFYNRMIRLDTVDLYRHYYEIYVIEQIYGATQEGDFEEEDVFFELAADGYLCLSVMFNDFLNCEFSSVNNYGDTYDFIHDEIKRATKLREDEILRKAKQ